jgi:hypothetical protein
MGGLCRAGSNGRVETIVSVGPQSDLASDYLTGLNLDGGKLYYVWSSDTTSETRHYSSSIHSVNVDGSGDQELYDLGGIPYYDVSGLFLYDGTLYVVYTSEPASSDASRTYVVTSMSEDGSDVRQLCSFQSNGSVDCVIADGKLFYVTGSGTGGKGGILYSQDLDGSNNKRLYSSTIGIISSAPVIQDGKLYFVEDSSGESAGKAVLTQLDENGANAKTLYSDALRFEGYDYLGAVVNGKAYVANGMVDTVGSVTVVPLDGGSAKTVDLPFTCGAATIGTAPDHLLLCSSLDGGNWGVDVCVTDFDLAQTRSYVRGGASTAGGQSTSSSSSSNGSTSSGSSSKVSYDGSTGRLVMSAFDFSVTLPSGLSCTTGSDGVTLREESSGMVIDASVKPNSQGKSLADLKSGAAAGHDLTTDAGRDDWFVVSYWDGDTGYYLREYVDGDTIAALEFTWPRSSADHCSQLIEDMSKTISDDN